MGCLLLLLSSYALELIYRSRKDINYWQATQRAKENRREFTCGEKQLSSFENRNISNNNNISFVQVS